MHSTTKTRFDLGFHRWAGGLLDQQMYCFGRDIKHPQGNLFVKWGFTRHPCPEGQNASTLYTGSVNNQQGTIWLWAFGVLYTEAGHGGVFLGRKDFTPKLFGADSAFGIHDVKQVVCRRPVSTAETQRCNTLLGKLVSWVARYEHWLMDTQSEDYRAKVLHNNPNATIVLPKEMAKSWETVAKYLDKHQAKNMITRKGPWGRTLGQLQPLNSTGHNHKKRFV